jgi:3',5'-cyclic AMP phosphodiesterase CpdA
LWLDEVLTREKARWVIISHHHPLFSVAAGRDNPALRQHWLPVYERHGVDLVLQGHDHAYGRGHNVAEGKSVATRDGGPVFVVSVAGPKQYIADERARAGLKVVGEDMQLYQVIRVDGDRLTYRSRTVTGRVYDAFDILQRPDGSKRFIEDVSMTVKDSRCQNPDRPRPTRCWQGDELTD